MPRDATSRARPDFRLIQVDGLAHLGLGCRVEGCGLGFRVLEFRVQGLGFRLRVQGLVVDFFQIFNVVVLVFG